MKWNPGHWAASEGVLSGSTTDLSGFQGEIADVVAAGPIVGYRLFVTWAQLETREGAYNLGPTSPLGQLFSQLKAGRKHLIVDVLAGTVAGGTYWSTQDFFPSYITSDATYGPSPIAGSYGWWGATGAPYNGGFTSAIWRDGVMARFVALIRAIGAAYGDDPYFDGFMMQEDSNYTGIALEQGTQDGTYSDAAFGTQMQNLFVAALDAMPTCSVMNQNTWMQYATPTQDLERWMIDHRIAPSSADTLGQSVLTPTFQEGSLAWGLQAYLGITASGSTYSGPDYRPAIHAMMDIEGPDLGAYGFSGYAATDLILALNDTYGASHAFWTHLGPGDAATLTQPSNLWTRLVPILAANPLTHTSYPESYP